MAASTVTPLHKLLHKAAKAYGFTCSAADAKGVADALAGELREVLASGNCTVSFGADVGRLRCGHRAARVGRNPATGASIRIPAKTTVKFIASKALKERL